MLIKQPHRPSLSVVNNASTTERCGALSFSPQLRYTPRVVVCEPVRHTLRGRRVFNGTARGTLYNIRNERALQLSRKRRDGNGSYNHNRFAKRITYFETSRKFLWMHVPLLQCMRLILRFRLILDVTPADVETGLSNVICY